MIWACALICLFFRLAACSADGEVWIIAPSNVKPNITNYISYFENTSDLAQKVRIYDVSASVPRISADSANFLKLEKLEPHMVSKIVIIGATTLPSSWMLVELVHFVAIGGQVILALSDNAALGLAYKDFLQQFGISTTRFPIVPQSYQTTQWNNELVNSVFEGEKPGKFVYPEQIPGLVLESNRSLSLLHSLLTPEPTAIILNKRQGTIERPASMTSLIALFQTKRNGRLAVFSSYRLLEDTFFNPSLDSSNFNSTIQVTRWAFVKRGIIKMPTFLTYSESEIHKYGSQGEKSIRILDTLNVLATMSTYSDKEGRWKPFECDHLQFEYVIMDPYIRKTLERIDATKEHSRLPDVFRRILSSIPDSEAVYFASSILPDRTGVATLRLFYSRRGFLLVDTSATIIVRHFAHNENHAKFVLGYPYYASMLSCLLGITLISFLFLLYWKKNNRVSKDDKNK